MRGIYGEVKDFTMIPEKHFIENLRLVDSHRNIDGSVVECGVWRGGMSAGMAMVLGPERDYYLFDSFEGLPPAKEIDGPGALKWQSKTDSPTYFDNCKAEMEWAESAMKKAGSKRYTLVKGWFEKTVPEFQGTQSIAVLRLDGDWYDSTIICLEHFYDRVIPGGIIIIDDYYVWDGCSRAVHDFLSRKSACERVRSHANFAYLVKLESR